ncbi:hypothetical protein B0H15DRAFT_989130 [Mycena belliarum]|uniref:Nudix hydrolase domain-containing protein n=1 Tax=Mycena belliarum TaxID=1033014 RepID=A0AAD6U4G5_9AGAR|nr:hypothetical protein B0H15DRAFT_989130 [Mycena belliae]
MPDTAPKPPRLLRYHYHRPRPTKLGAARLPPLTLTAESRRCIRNLAAHRAARPAFPHPRARSAAVLVALFAGRGGDLYVLLNRRSAGLRSYAGDTALPGGKVDPGDRTLEDTAIGLPRNKLKVPLLCVLEPFLASNHLIVTPVVVLILDNTIRPMLNAAEVASLFSHPLASFLSSSPPFPTEAELIEVPYHTTSDGTYPGPNGARIPARAHRFLTGREAGGIKPVFGLTAAILIHAAAIAYARAPDFEVAPPGAQTRAERIAWAVLSDPDFRRAYEAEGLFMNWVTVARLAGVRHGGAVEEHQNEDKDGRRRRRRAWSKL